mmetsp:Transcript_53797/g.149297  ORF Transcript_53797/g.149297 Transcript_53797/m.149297 type:complete len:377 (-) Transcript_53797:525-1655(-)
MDRDALEEAAVAGVRADVPLQRRLDDRCRHPAHLLQGVPGPLRRLADVPERADHRERLGRRPLRLPLRLRWGADPQASTRRHGHDLLVYWPHALRCGLVLRNDIHWARAERDRSGHRTALAAQPRRGQERAVEARLCLRLHLLCRRRGQHHLQPRGYEVHACNHCRCAWVEDQRGCCGRVQRHRWSADHAAGHRTERALSGSEEEGEHLLVSLEEEHAQGLPALSVPDLRADPLPGRARHGAVDRLPVLHAVAGAVLLHQWPGRLDLLGFQLGKCLFQPPQRLLAEPSGTSVPGPRPPDDCKLLSGHRHSVSRALLLRPAEAGRAWGGLWRGPSLLHILPDVWLGGRPVRHAQQEGLRRYCSREHLHVRLRHGSVD